MSERDEYRRLWPQQVPTNWLSDQLKAERDQARAERDEALAALRAFIAWMDDSRAPNHAPNLHRYMLHCALLERVEDRARAILAKHAKASEDTRGATVPARQGAGSPDGDYSQAPAPASDHGKGEQS